MSVNDRGTIKWTAMMLPEHAELLNQLKKRKTGSKNLYLMNNNLSKTVFS